MKAKEIKTRETSFPLVLKQTSRQKFTVNYGEQIRQGLNYTQAAHELGECLMHLLCCNGEIENE